MFAVRRHFRNLVHRVWQVGSVSVIISLLCVGLAGVGPQHIAQAGVWERPVAAPPRQDPQQDPQPEQPPDQLPPADATAIPPTPVPFVPRPVKPLELPPGTINIALLGVDTRPQFDYHNTDVIVIASINPDVPSVTMLSIPRDTYSYVPRMYLGKINQAYRLGGFEKFQETLMYNFGLKVDHFAMVNFQALVHSVDSFGGIEVVATCPIYHVFPRDPFYVGGLVVAKDYTDQFTGEVYPAGSLVPTQTIDIPKPGVYSLNGLQSLAYVRARKGIPGGDVDRGRREIRVIRALFAKAKQIGTLTKIPQLLADFQEDVTTDLTISDLLSMAGMADRFDDTVIRSRFLDAGGANGQAISDEVLYGPTLSDNFWRARRDYLQNILTVSVNQKASDGIPIEVINGTSDAGFAAAAADRLGEMGFRVTKISAASQTQAKTQIIDHTTTKKGSAVPLLTRTFNLQNNQVTADPKPDGVRYTIVLGPDFNTCYYAPNLQAAGSTEIDMGDAPVDPLEVLPSNIPVVAALRTPTPSPAATTRSPAGTRSANTTITATPVPTARPTTTPMPTIQTQAFVFVAGEVAINIRQTPSLSGTIIGTLSIGEEATILGRSPDNQWFQIRTVQNFTGWVNSGVVQVRGDTSRLPVV